MRSTAMASIALALAGVIWAAPALAQSCGEDLKKLGQRREAEMVTINGIIKAAKGKQIDPTVFCAKSSGLIAAENALIAYMEKNKDWCGVPDDVLAGLKANHVKSSAFAAKACKVAADLKKAKDQAANGDGPQVQPLPAGPL
jgi:hypothetical protein